MTAQRDGRAAREGNDQMIERIGVIFNIFSHKALDQAGRAFVDGDLAQQYQFHSGGNQRWRIIDTGLPAEMHGISPALSVTARLVYLVASHSGKALAPSLVDATKVAQYRFEPAPVLARRRGQLWQVVPVADGENVIRNVTSGTVMRLHAASQDDQVGAELGARNAQDATQRWEVFYQYALGPSAVGPIFNKNSHKCLDVPNADTGDDILIQQHIYNGGDNQKWVFAFSNVGVPATIRSLHSSKPLALKPLPGENPRVVQRGTPPTQNWALYVPTAGSDFWFIASQEIWSGIGGPVMDVIWGSRDDGAQIQAHDRHGGDNQLWELWVR